MGRSWEEKRNRVWKIDGCAEDAAGSWDVASRHETP